MSGVGPCIQFQQVASTKGPALRKTQQRTNSQFEINLQVTRITIITIIIQTIWNVSRKLIRNPILVLNIYKFISTGQISNIF